MRRRPARGVSGRTRLLQALTTLNDETFIEFAEGLAARVIQEVTAGDKERIRYAFELVVARPPTAVEQERMSRFLARELDEYKTNPSLAAQLIFKGAEFGPDGKAKYPPPPKLAKMLPADMPLEAAWAGVSRVLLNLDDFLTRE